MSIQIITGFEVNSSQPIDNRIVASGSSARNAIPYKYDGLRVFDTYDNIPYVWVNGSWTSENSTNVSGSGTVNYLPKFNSSNTLGNSVISQNGSNIGINTTTPGSTLQVNGTVRFIGSSFSAGYDPNYTNFKLIPANNSTELTVYYPADNSYKTSIKQFSTYTEFVSSGETYFNLANSGSRSLLFGRAGSNAQIRFLMDNSTSDLPDLGGKGVYIDKNLRIAGTSSTSFMYISNNYSGLQGLVLSKNTAGSKQGLFIDWSSPTNGSFAGILGVSSTSGGELRFYTTSSNSGTVGSTSTRSNRMLITNDGRIGINTTTPTNKLEVNGTFSSTQIGINNIYPKSTLDVYGSISTKHDVKSANYTLTSSDFAVECNGTLTITLPPSSGITGRMYVIKNIGTGVITIDGYLSETIDGNSSKVLKAYESAIIQCSNNVSDWITISSDMVNTDWTQYTPTFNAYTSADVLIPSGVTCTGVTAFWKIDKNVLFIRMSTQDIDILNASARYILISLPSSSLISGKYRYGTSFCKFGNGTTGFPVVSDIYLSSSGAGIGLNIRKVDETNFGILSNYSFSFTIAITLI